MASEPNRTSGTFRFGEDFDLDPRSYELRRSGRAIKLERIPMEVLLLLVEAAPQLVSRDEIIEKIWGKGVFLDTDTSINSAIRKIRQALTDDSEQPRFIQTVIGRGYRFIAPVTLVSPEQASPGQQAAGSPSLIGQRISDYRILKLLGGGGMGVVYQAEDLKLGRQVAMKFLPEELAADPTAFERLKREARAASSLDHPNICAIYQLGEHQGRPFIVMQMLEGQTLRDWIESKSNESAASRLPSVLDLAVQIADGLEAAHRKGIVHRDIKPTNIFVTRQDQAKILDFGVAKFLEQSEAHNPAPVTSVAGSESAGSNPARQLDQNRIDQNKADQNKADQNLTETGVSLGTPSYCSPEQVRHEKLDARTDLFSLGLVLHEMATGKRAFSGSTAPAIRDAILSQTAEPIRQLDNSLPPELERIIGKALEKDPARRYQSAQDLRTDLDHLRHSLQDAIQWPRIKWAWVLAGAATLALAVSLGIVLERGWHRTPQTGAIPAIRPRRSVAVLGFRNLSGKPDQEWISTALAEMLGTELASGDKLRVVSGENIAHMKHDLSLPTTDTYAPGTLAKIRSDLGADDVVMGSYLGMGEDPKGSLRIDLRVQHAIDGETIAAITESGSETEINDLVSRASASLRDKLGVSGLSEAEVHGAKISLPASSEALRYYSEGLEKLRAFDALAARDLLQKAIAADPNHAMSHSLLAQCLAALGYDTNALAEAKKAFDLSQVLPRHEQLLVEGRYREMSHDYVAAIDIYRSLWRFFPDDVDNGLRLATAQTKASLPKDALVTVAQMRNLPEPVNQDPRIDIAEANASDSLADFKRCQQAAAAAGAKAQRLGSRLGVAEAKEREAWAWDRLGELDKSAAEYAEARDLSLQGGNPRVATNSINGIANVLYDKGDFEGARKAYENALTIARQTGAQRNVSSFLGNIGNVCYEQGKLEEARQYYEQALKIDHELGNERYIASDLGNLANVMQSMGDLPGALRMHDQSLQAFRNSGDRRGEASTLNNLGNVLTDQGQLELAKSKFEEAMIVQQQIGYRRGRGFSLNGISIVLQSEDHLPEARAKTEEAIALRKELGDTTNLAYSQMQLAYVTLDQGKFTEAEVLARDAAAAFDKQKVAEAGCKAEAILGRALLAEGKVNDAQVATDRAMTLCGQSSDREARFEGQFADAAVNAQSGKSADALKTLEAMRAETNRFGYVGYDLETRLEIGEIELKSGKIAAGRSHLVQVQNDARSRGFALIARKANIAAGSAQVAAK